MSQTNRNDKFMESNKDILDKIDRRDGLTVPEGYFDDFARRMSASLPDRPELTAQPVAKRSTWNRIRPYVYMAAMFAGVWCMLKMFMLMSESDTTSLNIDENPALAKVASDEQFIEDYVIDDLSGWDLYNSVLEDSVDVYNLLDSIYNSNPDFIIPDEGAVSQDKINSIQ